jgi:hypothetical protein
LLGGAALAPSARKRAASRPSHRAMRPLII